MYTLEDEEIDKILTKVKDFIDSEDCMITFETFKKRFIERMNELEKLINS